MPTLLSAFAVDPLRIGGSETFSRELSRQLAAEGWRSVLSFLANPSGAMHEFLVAENVEFHALPHLAVGGVRDWFGFCAALVRYRPRIVHLHCIGFIGPLPWLARLCGVRQIFFTDHSSRPAGHVPERSAWWKRLLSRAINLPVDRVICVSQYGFDCCTALDLLPVERFSRVYNAVDVSRVKPSATAGSAFKRTYGIPEDRIVVLQVSWIIPAKGIPDLLRAAVAVVSANPMVHFVLVGEGDYRTEYTRQAEAAGLAEHITWTGLVQDPFGAGVFDAADIVCQVSDWEEVFGWTITEAMAACLPVIATRVGGIPELVADGKSGYLIERGDVNALVDRLLTLAADADARRALGRAGRAIAEEKFELTRNVRELVQLYAL